MTLYIAHYEARGRVLARASCLPDFALLGPFRASICVLGGLLGALDALLDLVGVLLDLLACAGEHIGHKQHPDGDQPDDHPQPPQRGADG